MKLLDLFEAPFTDKQEKEFFKRVKDDPAGLRNAEKHIATIAPRTSVRSGSFSDVFTKNSSKYAVKILKNDPRGLKYLEWCAANQSNPYVPKIYSIKKDGNIAYIRMEKLEEFPSNYKWAKKHLPFLWFFHSHVHELYKGTWARAFGVKIPTEETYHDFKYEDFFPDKKAFDAFKAKMKSTEDPIVPVIKAAQKFAWGPDDLDLVLSVYGAKNIMVRPSTNHIVITDPIAS